MGYRITDGEGWFVKKLRKADRKEFICLWSSNARDAADIHFHEVAVKIAESLPFPVKVVWRRDRKS